MKGSRWKLEFRLQDQSLDGGSRWLYSVTESKPYSETYTHVIIRGIIVGLTGDWNCLITNDSCWVPGVEFPPQAKHFETLQQAKVWARKFLTERRKEHDRAMEREIRKRKNAKAA